MFQSSNVPGFRFQVSSFKLQASILKVNTFTILIIRIYQSIILMILCENTLSINSSWIRNIPLETDIEENACESIFHAFSPPLTTILVSNTALLPTRSEITSFPFPSSCELNLTVNSSLNGFGNTRKSPEFEIACSLTPPESGTWIFEVHNCQCPFL